MAAELTALEEVVVAIGAPTSTGERACDRILRARGALRRGRSRRRCGWPWSWLAMGIFRPPDDGSEGPVPEGSFREAPVFETNADAVFCALQARRIPAKRHPLGLRLRIDELLQDQVIDDGGDLWQRRIEEIDAAAAALCAHRYAVGHASWLGDPDEGVVVLPGTSIPQEFSTAGVLPPVERLHLPRVD